MTFTLRFPRVRRFVRRCAVSPGLRDRVATLLRVTYNALARQRDFGKRRIHFDIYRTKQGAIARRCFLILAGRLVRAGIDPSLYLKVLSRYGFYQRSRVMPSVLWLYSDRALQVYAWLGLKDRDKYKHEADWRKILRIEPETVSAQVDRQLWFGWRLLGLLKDTPGDLQTKILSNLGALPDWFLACSFEFYEAGGLRVLDEARRRELQRKINFLAGQEKLRRAADLEYARLKRLFLP